MWAVSYELKAYGTVTETLTLTIANFYSLKLQVFIDLFKLQVLKQSLTFVHPWAILVAKNENPRVDIPFDLKLKS